MSNKKTAFLKNLIGFSLATWVTFVIGFIATPISTRLYNTSELGKINLFNTYATLISTFVLLGLDQSYVRFYEECRKSKKEKKLLGFCLNVAFIAVALTGFILLFFHDFVSWQVLGSYGILAPICMIIYAFGNTASRYVNLNYRMMQDTKWYNIQAIVFALISKLMYLGVAFLYADAKIAIIALSLSVFVSSMIFLYIRRSYITFNVFKKIDKALVKDISKYAIPLIPVSILSWANNSVSNIVLRQLLGFSNLGIYSTAVTLASTINLIQAGFGVYWAPYVYKNYENDNKSSFWTIHKLMSCCLALFGIAIILFQPIIFLLIGKNYRDSMLFFPLLMLSPICYTLAETTGFGINISKKTYWNLIIFSITIVLNIALCYIFIPFLGTAGAATAAAIVAIVMLIVRTVIGERYYKSIENYSYAIKCVGITLSAALINYIFFDYNIIKNILIIFILILSLFIFRNEIKFLLSTAKEIISHKKGEN